MAGRPGRGIRSPVLRVLTPTIAGSRSHDSRKKSRTALAEFFAGRASCGGDAARPERSSRSYGDRRARLEQLIVELGERLTASSRREDDHELAEGLPARSRRRRVRAVLRESRNQRVDVRVDYLVADESMWNGPSVRRLEVIFGVPSGCARVAAASFSARSCERTISSLRLDDTAPKRRARSARRRPRRHARALELLIYWPCCGRPVYLRVVGLDSEEVFRRARRPRRPTFYDSSPLTGSRPRAGTRFFLLD